ncbi:helix-turn-helix domain-containing protein [Candidatus Woesearchaeota archaeon]|nr:helix-turn-helix domain-containing protein [Candidatus Woesearchaeota archaeon]MCF7901313.1 helix-turn-helix domain-containing protein [Candidatus Woesearchaeota archaeon]MCF8013781.1 helix-turn-helix domain-containing protein [Candidatus Woesearchaeota archaeon]
MAEKSFILMSLKDKKSKKLASLLNSDTARNILEHLSKKEFATESDISKETGIPLSTVHYNLKLLRENNLVNEEEFHYSEKGKEVVHYKAANKYIIIAPKEEEDSILEKLKNIIPSFIGLIVVSGLWLLNKFLTVGGANLAESTAAYSVQDQVVRAAPEAMMLKTSQAAPIVSNSGSLEPIFWFVAGGIFVLAIYGIFVSLKKLKKR